MKKEIKENVLFAWMGNTDEDVLNSDKDKKKGPIGAVLLAKNYDRVVILCGSKFHPVLKKYEIWLKELCTHQPIVTIKKIDLKDPTDLKTIYMISLQIVREVFENNPDQINAFFQTSSGTPQMQAAWMFLKRRFNATLLKSAPDKGVSELDFPFDLSAQLIQESDLSGFSSTEDFVCESEEMKAVVSRAENWAKLSQPVLIEGESGTGKEEIAARLFKHRFNLSEGRKIDINCGAFPKNLVESELFGYVKGAFTGAESDRAGKIEQADKGVLFLDEIGEMPLDVQTRLLRVLEDKKVQKIGDNKSKNVEFRLISATNRNLTQEVAKGNFREDLYYRISMIYLPIPPLRDRGAADIKALANYFLKKFNEEFKKIPGYVTKSLSEDAEHQLVSYGWPGNIRELRNTLFQACIWNPEEPRIVESDILRSLGRSITAVRMEDLIKNLELPPDMTLEDMLEDIKRKYLIKALKKCGGNVTQAFKSLGYPNRNLHMLEKLNINPKDYKPV